MRTLTESCVWTTIRSTGWSLGCSFHGTVTTLNIVHSHFTEKFLQYIVSSISLNPTNHPPLPVNITSVESDDLHRPHSNLIDSPKAVSPVLRWTSLPTLYDREEESANTAKENVPSESKWFPHFGLIGWWSPHILFRLRKHLPPYYLGAAGALWSRSTRAPIDLGNLEMYRLRHLGSNVVEVCLVNYGHSHTLSWVAPTVSGCGKL